MTGAPRRIAITGATGLIGAALAESLRAEGHVVLSVSRHAPTDIRWDPARRRVDAAPLERLDAVVHLAGENLAGGRWTDERKRRLRASRIDVTRWFAELLTRLAHPPRVLVSASAVGIYGDRGDELLDEHSSAGNDFLARLAVDWEHAADPARHAGIRVVHPRFGVVLSTRGGALAKLLLPFRLGVGGPIGNGQQWLSWVTLDDAVSALRRMILDETLAGAANVVAPVAVRNREFATALGRALHRPAFLPVPAVALRLVLGELADATLLASQRTVPTRLDAAGFRHQFPALDDALRHLLATGR